MANSSVSTGQKGNFTDDADMHLWCASALGHVVSSPEAMGQWSEDIKQGLQFLLSCEIERAKNSLAAKNAVTQ